MRSSRYTGWPGALVVMLLAAGCGGTDGEGGGAGRPPIPEFAEPRLEQGRAVWMQVCRNCHLMGVAGAPAIDDFAAWEPRLAKGTEALYASAINGIKGADGWAMPPRGGNDKLSAAQVRRAVDFMTAAVKKLAGGEDP